MTTVLPNGSAFSCASFPLPKDRWSTAPGYNTPPMRLRMGINDPRREAWDKIVREAAQYAIRASTHNGTDNDIDPDALVQNMIVGLLGYHTSDGLSHDPDVPEFDPDPVPEGLHLTILNQVTTASGGTGGV